MHSTQMEVLDGIPMEEAECQEPLLISVLDTPLDSKAMAGNMMGSSSDRTVPQKDQTGRAMEGVTSTQLHLDSQPRGYQSMPNRKKYLWSDEIPNRQAKPPGNRTVPSVGVQNKTPDRKVCFYGNQTESDEGKDNAVQTAPSVLTEDPMSRNQSDPFIRKPVPDIHAGKRKSEVRSLAESSWQTGRSLAQTYQPEYTGSSQESGEAIVVGAIGSAAPWFLTG